jgi:hypothetical protein
MTDPCAHRSAMDVRGGLEPCCPYCREEDKDGQDPQDPRDLAAHRIQQEFMEEGT